jgi:phage shock protein E
MLLPSDYEQRAKQYCFASRDEIKMALLRHDTVLLDVRNIEEIDSDGRVSQYDATHTCVQTECTPTECKSLSECPEKVLQTKDKSVTIVIYCKSGRRASTAKRVLQEKGYNGNILNAGGYNDIKVLLEV